MGFVERYAKQRSEKDPEFKRIWEKAQSFVESKVKQFIEQGFTEEEAYRKALDELDKLDDGVNE